MLSKSAPPKSLSESTTRSMSSRGRPTSSIDSASTSYIQGCAWPLISADWIAQMMCSCCSAPCN